MRSAFALRIISGRTILNFGVVTENGICSAAFCESAALRASAGAPLGEQSSVASLRGYKWRSEQSVKAIAPTGAALAFFVLRLLL